MGLAGVFDGVVQQCCDCLVFAAAVFPHQGADPDQVCDVRNLFAFAELLAVQRLSPSQRFAVAGGEAHRQQKRRSSEHSFWLACQALQVSWGRR